MLRRIARGAAVAVTAIGAVALSSSPAAAQLGTGWTQYTPPESLQIRGCAAHSASGGVDQFRVTCADMGGDNRAEHRTQNDYSSGTNQFEGEIRVVESGANIIVKQTFMPNRGAFLMMAVSADGRLYLHGGGGDVLPNVVGRWVKINTIHDVSAGTHQMYADGVLRTTKRGGQQVAWHDKYGSYRSQSGRGPAVIEWRNIKYFRGGRAPDGASPPPPNPARDAGPPDLRPDAAAPDGSGNTGGSGGSGGEGGSGGAAGGATGTGGAAAGGATGSGGTTGTAGSTAPRPPGTGGRSAGSPPTGPAAPPSSGGCALGSTDTDPPVTGWALLAVALAIRTSRRRRPAR